MTEYRLRPSEISFTQDNISSIFYGGQGVNETIEAIMYGRMSPSDLPNMMVVRRNGKYYSFDNRRLYVMRVLEKRHRIWEVEVDLWPEYMWSESKFTTNNDGYSIEVRGDVTHPHTFGMPPPPK